MKVNFSSINPTERPTLILRNANGKALGNLGCALNITPKLMYNEVSELSFTLPAMVNGIKTPVYDQVVGRMIVDLKNVGQFILMNPKETGDGISREKQCTAYSLEYEFSQKKITIPNGTYKFYDEEDPDGTLLGMLLEDMPSWSVATVPASVAGKYRTFEVSNENRYNFIKSTVQRTYRCIFNFDTYTRKIYIDDAAREPIDKQVYLSSRNLANNISVEEQTEDIVTRLDVNGADGISIRDVNPNGTNKLINLDYYMTTENFDQVLIDKYTFWKTLNANNRDAYYSLSVRYTLAQEEIVAKTAELTDLQGELTSLDNIRAVVIQGIAQGLKTQSDLDTANQNLSAKQTEVSAKEAQIASAKESAEALYAQMQQICAACSFNKYFTSEELVELDKYLIDDEIQDTSFVAASTSFDAETSGTMTDTTGFAVSKSAVQTIEPASGGTIYRITGGTFTDNSGNTAEVISGEISVATSGTVCSFRMGETVYGGETYPQSCMTFTATDVLFTVGRNGDSISMSAADGKQYFTLSVTEYEKRSIAWELLEYGEEVLAKLARPSYTFDVSSANFFAQKDFTVFKNALTLGERIYLELLDGSVIKPVCIGVSFTYHEPDSLELSFGDKYVSGDSGNTLVDLLEQSVSMGKTLDAKQFAYADYTNSGAGTSIAKFMTSALDVAKNALFSSSGNAVSFDGSGLHLRKWTDASQEQYDPEQIWMVNNSIVMTDDGWETAKLAIGKFQDENLGTCWGVVAPMLVGTLLAGQKLVIESEKKDGGVSVFRVDGDGARLYNSNFVVTSDNRSVLIDPDVGIAIGSVGFYSVGSDGSYTIDKTKSNFYVDENGNIYLRGSVTATQLNIGNQTFNSYLENYLDENTGDTATFVQPEAPTSGFREGDLWRDSDSPYSYLYVAVSTTGVSANDWQLVATQALKGAAISTNAEDGTIDVAAASTLTLASGKLLTIAGGGGIVLSSTNGIKITGGAGIALNAGTLTLGSDANKLTSAGVLSLANGNILLDGTSNTVTVGKGGGTVNIGTDGQGVINLATYSVKSDTKSVSYAGSFASGGTSASSSASNTITYTATSDEGTESDTTFTVTHTYTSAAKVTTSAPSIASAKLLQLVYSERGINIYADTANPKTILSPSVTAGHLMGWEMVGAKSVSATNVSAGTVIADNLYVTDASDASSLIAVANQKWTIDTVVSILNNNDVIPAIKKKLDNTYWRAWYHSHEVTTDADGNVKLGKVVNQGNGGTFNVADTTFYKDGVSAAKQEIIDSITIWAPRNTETATFVVKATDKSRATVYKTLDCYMELSAKTVKAFVDNVNAAVIDVSGVYNNGWMDAAKSVDMPGAIAAGIESTTFDVAIPSDDSVGKTLTRTYKLTTGMPSADGYAAVSCENYAVARIQIGDWYTAGEAAGKQSVIDSIALWAPKNTESGSFVINATDKNRSTIYKTIDCYLELSSKTVKAFVDNVNAAVLDVSSVYNSGWNDAVGKVKMPSAVAAGEEVTSFDVVVPNETVGKDITRTFTLATGTPAASGYAAVSYGNYAVARISIGNWYTSGYSAGETAGWKTAANAVVMPSEGKTTSFTVTVPSVTKGVVTTATFTMADPTSTTPSGSGYVYVKNSDGDYVSRIDVGRWYTAGQNTVTLSSAWSGAKYTVTASNGKTASTQVALQASGGGADNFTIACVSTVGSETPATRASGIVKGELSGQTVNIKFGDTVYGTLSVASVYNNGWKAAANSVVMPSAVTGGESLNFTVKTPSATTVGNTTSTTFTMSVASPSASGGFVTVLYNGAVVAKANVSSWYTAGYSAGETAGKSAGESTYKSNLSVWGVSGTTEKFTVSAGNKNTRVADATASCYMELSGSTSSATVKAYVGNVNAAVISVGSLYTAGYNSGYSTGKTDGKTAYNPTAITISSGPAYDSSTNTYSFGVKATNNSGYTTLLTDTKSFVAEDAYNAGYNTALDGVWVQLNYSVVGSTVQIKAYARDKNNNLLDMETGSVDI